MLMTPMLRDSPEVLLSDSPGHPRCIRSSLLCYLLSRLVAVNGAEVIQIAPSSCRSHSPPTTVAREASGLSTGIEPPFELTSELSFRWPTIREGFAIEKDPWREEYPAAHREGLPLR